MLYLALSPLLLCTQDSAPADSPETERPVSISTATGEFTLQGRWMHDWIDASPQALQDTSTSDETRRLRLLLDGSLDEWWSIRAQAELKGGEQHLLEWMVNWKPGNKPQIRIGHFREPFGLGASTSSAHLPFIERSTPTEALTFGRNRGLQLRQESSDRTWAVGVFREGKGLADEGTVGNHALTGRYTVLTLQDTDPQQFLHLGGALTLRDTSASGVAFSSGPEAHLARRVIDTGPLDASRALGLGVEAAYVRGSLMAQSELVLSRISSSSGEGATLKGGYVQLTHFLRGHTRAYRKATSSIGGVEPDQAMSGSTSLGALEAGIRYSRSDLDSGFVDGGNASSLTLGVTWHRTTNSRWMINHLRSHLPGDRMKMWLLRFHVGF